MSKLATVARWVIALFLLAYAAMYTMLPILFLLFRLNVIELDDGLIPLMTVLDSILLLSVSVLFTISALCLFWSKSAALVFYFAGLVVDIAANVTLAFRLDTDFGLTPYDYAQDTSIMLGILVVLIWLKLSKRLN